MSSVRRHAARSARGAVLVLRCRRQVAGRPAGCQCVLSRRWSHCRRRNWWLEQCDGVPSCAAMSTAVMLQCMCWMSHRQVSLARHECADARSLSLFKWALKSPTLSHNTTASVVALDHVDARRVMWQQMLPEDVFRSRPVRTPVEYPTCGCHSARVLRRYAL